MINNIIKGIAKALIDEFGNDETNKTILLNCGVGEDS